MLEGEKKWSWAIYLFLETQLFMFTVSPWWIAWPELSYVSDHPCWLHRSLVWRAQWVWKESFSPKQSLTVISTEPVIPSLPLWRGVMYSRAAFYTAEIPGSWPYTSKVNLFTWTFENLWLTLPAATNEPVNKVLLRAVHSISPPGKRCEKPASHFYSDWLVGHF